MENGQQTAHYFASPDFIARAQIISDVVTTPSRTQTLIQTPRGIWQVVVLVMECPGGSCMCLDDYLSVLSELLVTVSQQPGRMPPVVKEEVELEYSSRSSFATSGILSGNLVECY